MLDRTYVLNLVLTYIDIRSGVYSVLQSTSKNQSHTCKFVKLTRRKNSHCDYGIIQYIYVTTYLRVRQIYCVAVVLIFLFLKQLAKIT